jgi:protein-tyrosine-phosphatase
MLAESALVIAAAPEHVAWVRREHPVHVDRTATLIHLVRSLSTNRSPLTDRVSDLDLGEHRSKPDEEIVDPGGGELELYVRVAHQIVSLVDDLADRL